MGHRLRLQRKVTPPAFSPDDTVYALDLGGSRSFPAATLVLDLCAFTNIARLMDDGGVLGLLQEILGGLALHIDTYGGLINKFPGDGVMALFPEASLASDDNAANIALHCAVRCMSWFYDETDFTTRRFKQRPSYRLGLCAGADYGRVTVGLVGSTNQSEFILIGDSVNAASKCQQSAKPRAVVVGREARNHSTLHKSWFTVGPPIGVTMKSVAKPYRSFRFRWDAMSKLPIVLPTLSPASTGLPLRAPVLGQPERQGAKIDGRLPLPARRQPPRPGDASR